MAHARKWSPVLVTWLDAESSYDAVHSETYIANYKPCIRKTVGFLLHRDKDRVFVAMDDDHERAIGDGSDCQTVTVLPTCMIITVEYL